MRWTFNNENNWHDNYPQCIVENIQSPIDIDSDNTDSCNLLCKLELNYSNFVMKSRITDNLITLLTTQNNTVIFNDNTYLLDKITFHLPSQHTVKGNTYKMEINFHHTPKLSSINENLIIALFVTDMGYNEKSSKEFSKIVQNLPVQKNSLLSSGVTIDLLNILPKYKSFYTYKGSLPYPPCTKNYIWVIFDNPTVISLNEYKILKSKIFKNVRRPLQKIGDRKVYYNNNYSAIKVNDEGDGNKRLRCKIVNEKRRFIPNKCPSKVKNEVLQRNSRENPTDYSILINVLTMIIVFIYLLFIAWATLKFLEKCCDAAKIAANRID